MRKDSVCLKHIGEDPQLQIWRRLQWNLSINQKHVSTGLNEDDYWRVSPR